MAFKKYTRAREFGEDGITTITREIRDYVKGEDLTNIFVDSAKEPDADMGVIVKNIEDGSMWYANREYFERTYTLVE